MLANIEHNPNNMKIYEQKSIQKIIDFHFALSRWYFRLMFFVHVVFFIIPIFFILYVPQDSLTQRIACIVALVSQCIFFLFELVQIYGEGPFEYLFKLGIWNATDLLRFFLFLAYYIMRENDQFANPGVIGKDDTATSAGNQFSKIVLLWLCEILALIKVTHFLGIYEISFLVQMVILCF